ncbi:MAG TPA: 16S rRNA (uracil(1498)-N(3))-methyltransferase [bacterium]|nr:16S rRNA (uracil(1498)-N(3))-methyltransferase [bacterium]
MPGKNPIVIERAPALGDTVALRGPALAALTAWSPRPGLAVTVADGSGNSYRARVTELHADRASLFVFERMKGPAESPLEIILLQALPDKERMELIIEKAAELGADVIVPWKAERGVGLDERDARQKKSRGWQKRALKAARQCRRGKVPFIAPYADLDAALDYAAGADLKIVLWEEARAPLKKILESTAAPRSVAIMIGPEGGLTPAEVETAERSGFISASLGPRVLRTETAAIAALALAQYALGDLGS